jgi:hypothetical protein
MLQLNFRDGLMDHTEVTPRECSVSWSSPPPKSPGTKSADESRSGRLTWPPPIRGQQRVGQPAQSEPPPAGKLPRQVGSGCGAVDTGAAPAAHRCVGGTRSTVDRLAESSDSPATARPAAAPGVALRRGLGGHEAACTGLVGCVLLAEHAGATALPLVPPGRAD